jgi:hypothetical protein
LKIAQTLSEEVVRRTGFVVPDKMVFLEKRHMRLMMFDICCQYDLKIAKVAMRESPKKG